MHFNPHHREGGDAFSYAVRSSIDISIHTTAKVVTSSICVVPPAAYISIHTTAKVVTQEEANADGLFVISIHTTARW